LPKKPARAAASHVRVFVDSGAWIALLSSNDDHHAEADALIRSAVASHTMLLTSNLVIGEVHRFLLFRAGIRAARVAIGRIEDSPSARIEFATHEHHQAALAWLSKLDDQVISYTDATSFAMMQAARCKLAISFDHDFVVAGFQLMKL
jgi:uncharacterized protein